MKQICTALLAVFVLAGCGGHETVSEDTGLHFQGRDCLACHNVDLEESSYLSVGGTVYRSATSDINDLNEACAERLHVEFGGPGLSTKDANPTDAAGYKGRGNVFALIKDMPITGTYAVSIVQDDGTVLDTSAIDHPFLGNFDPANTTDVNNRYSCNACHYDGSPDAPGQLFATGCI